MLLCVINKMPYHKGSFPNWSSSFRNDPDYKIYTSISKLFACLIRGVCARYMLTGLEHPLEQWALLQKDQSLSPEFLFYKAMQLSEGNISIALLTTQNMLSWHSKAENRHMTLLQTKLRPFITIKGDKSQDKFGEWYHLFGLMSYGFSKGKNRAQLVGLTESIGGRILSRFQTEKVEEEVNKIAPFVAEALCQSLK